MYVLVVGNTSADIICRECVHSTVKDAVQSASSFYDKDRCEDSAFPCGSCTRVTSP
jgi:hypothetical protein